MPSRFAGFVVGVWARTVLGGNWSSSAAFKQGQELIERGPYRYVRHPLYSGILLLVVGLAIWSGSIFGTRRFCSSVRSAVASQSTRRRRY